MYFYLPRLEAELLHTLGVLLVEAYESSVETSKSTIFLDRDDHETSDGSCSLPYGLFPNSTDMFYVPPPPLSVIEYDKESNSYHSKDVHTIVPGQICAAAERRNIRPNKIYGACVALSEEDNDKEMEFEVGLYFKDCSDSDEDHGCDGDNTADTADAEGDASSVSVDAVAPMVAPPVPPAAAPVMDPPAAPPAAPPVAAPVAANAPQPAAARNALDALRAHPRFEELRRRFQNNFSSAQNLLNEIIQQHPGLINVIDTNQAAFYELMSQ